MALGSGQPTHRDDDEASPSALGHPAAIPSSIASSTSPSRSCGSWQGLLRRPEGCDARPDRTVWVSGEWLAVSCGVVGWRERGLGLRSQDSIACSAGVEEWFDGRWHPSIPDPSSLSRPSYRARLDDPDRPSPHGVLTDAPPAQLVTGTRDKARSRPR